MSLTNRFSALLLAMLGVTLVGFSAALFASSRVYLDRQADERLGAILTLLGHLRRPQAGVGPLGAEGKCLPPSRWKERQATTWLAYDGQGRMH